MKRRSPSSVTGDSAAARAVANQGDQSGSSFTSAMFITRAHLKKRRTLYKILAATKRAGRSLR
jgi:hypothetical protein